MKRETRVLVPKLSPVIGVDHAFWLIVDANAPSNAYDSMTTNPQKLVPRSMEDLS
jgi:hypothetical protein